MSVPANRDPGTEWAEIGTAFGVWLDQFRDGFPGSFDQDDMEAAFRAGWLHESPAPQSEEDKIREAMTEAQDHPGRIITR